MYVCIYIYTHSYVYNVLRGLREFLGTMRGMTPWRRGLTGLPTHPAAPCIWWELFKRSPRAVRKALVVMARSGQARRAQVLGAHTSLSVIWRILSVRILRHRFLVQRGAAAAHAFKKHGRKRDVRRHLVTTHCPICLALFHCRERAVARTATLTCGAA